MGSEDDDVSVARLERQMEGAFARFAVGWAGMFCMIVVTAGLTLCNAYPVALSVVLAYVTAFVMLHFTFVSSAYIVGVSRDVNQSQGHRVLYVNWLIWVSYGTLIYFSGMGSVDRPVLLQILSNSTIFIFSAAALVYPERCFRIPPRISVVLLYAYQSQLSIPEAYNNVVTDAQSLSLFRVVIFVINYYLFAQVHPSYQKYKRSGMVTAILSTVYPLYVHPFLLVAGVAAHTMPMAFYVGKLLFPTVAGYVQLWYRGAIDSLTLEAGDDYDDVDPYSSADSGREDVGEDQYGHEVMLETGPEEREDGSLSSEGEEDDGLADLDALYPTDLGDV